MYVTKDMYTNPAIKAAMRRADPSLRYKDFRITDIRAYPDGSADFEYELKRSDVVYLGNQRPGVVYMGKRYKGHDVVYLGKRTRNRKPVAYLRG